MPWTEIDRILDELAREHDGDPWHGSPLLHILDGVTAASASARPIPDGHSIWELLLHITAWKNEVRRRLSGAPAADPEEGDWPDAGEPSETRWHEARERLQRAHDDLRSAIRAFPEEKLYTAINDPRSTPLGTGVSYYVLLHGIVQHDVYHAGQIAILKKGSTGFR
jgi:uncharacterized damage-inducible protein DinB